MNMKNLNSTIVSTTDAVENKVNNKYINRFEYRSNVPDDNTPGLHKFNICLYYMIWTFTTLSFKSFV